MLSFDFRIFCWYRGFCHRTGSDLLLFLFILKEKKTKARTPTETSKAQSDNKYNATKSSITQRLDRLRTVSWSNYGHPTGVVNLSTEDT